MSCGRRSIVEHVVPKKKRNLATSTDVVNMSLTIAVLRKILYG